jgi:hypothetical protein
MDEQQKAVEDFKRLKAFEEKVLIVAKEKFGRRNCYTTAMLNEVREELKEGIMRSKPVPEILEDDLPKEDVPIKKRTRKRSK